MVFPLVKELKLSPREIAEKIGDYLVVNSSVVSFNIVSGFLNLSIADEQYLSFFNSKSDLLYRIGNNGKPGLSPGMFVSPHSIAYDSYGNIYVGDVVETDWAHLFGNKVKPIDIRRFQRFLRTGMWKEFTKQQS